VYVVDQNRDRQMHEIIGVEVGADSGRLRSIRHYDGFPLDAESVVEGVEAGEKN
jgi:2-oxoglutarate ferredoxin oxidoreductase subunit alpha